MDTPQSLIRLTPASGWWICCIAPPVARSPRSIAAKRGVLEQRDDLRFRVGVVAGDEDHALAAGLVWIRAEHFGAERVGGLDHARAGNKVGDELARRSPWRSSAAQSLVASMTT